MGEGSAANLSPPGLCEVKVWRAGRIGHWTYDGWIAVSMIAGEVVAPERLMKASLFRHAVIVTLYVGANLAYLYMMPVDVLAQQKAPSRAP